MLYTKRPIKNILEKYINEWEIYVINNYTQNIKLYSNVYLMKEYEYIFTNFGYFSDLKLKKILKIGSILKKYYNEDGFYAFNILMNLNSNITISVNKILYSNILIKEKHKEDYIYNLMKKHDLKKYNEFIKKKFSFKIVDLLILIHKLYLFNILQKSYAKNKYEIYYCSNNNIWLKELNTNEILLHIKKYFIDESSRLNINFNDNIPKIKIIRIYEYLNNNRLFHEIPSFDENNILAFNNLHYDLTEKKISRNKPRNVIITTTNYDWINIKDSIIEDLLILIDNIIENKTCFFNMFKNIFQDKKCKLNVFIGSKSEIEYFSNLIIKTFGNYLELIDSKNLLCEKTFNNLDSYKNMIYNKTHYKKLLIMFENIINEPLNVNILDKFINNDNYYKKLSPCIILTENFLTNVELYKTSFNKINFIYFKYCPDIILNDELFDDYKYALIIIILDYINNL